MKRILVPTDFSPTAEKAFRFACDIAARSNAAVTLYHAYTPVESPMAGTEKTRQEYNQETATTLLKQLQRLKNKVAEDYPHTSMSTVLGEGAIVSEILHFTSKAHYDLVVMGTQGVSGISKSIIGSVAARVIEKSAIPVLLIPEKYDWNEPGNIVFASNYQPFDKAALEEIVRFAELYQAKATVVHLYDLYEMEEEKERKKFDEYARELRENLDNAKLDFQFLKVSSVREAMETIDKIIPCDIVAMVRSRKTFLEKLLQTSFTQNMAYLNTLPILVIPDPGK